MKSLSLSLIFLFLFFPFQNSIAQTCIIETVAGNGADTGSTWGDEEQAIAARIRGPESIVVDSSGNLYIAGRDSHRIRKVTPDGIISTFAGGGAILGDNGPATSARMDPWSLAIDSEGNLYVADEANDRIRKITPEGIINTVVGGCSSGCSREDGVPVDSFELGSPISVAVNADGHIYFSGWSPGEGWVTIHKVSEGIVHRVAGTGRCGYSRGGETGPALEACLTVVEDLAFGNNGDLYIADADSHHLRKISDGVISSVAGGGERGRLGDGGPATNAHLNEPYGVAMDSRGNVFFVDKDQERLRKISSVGIITTVAGTGEAGFSESEDGGPARAARLHMPVDVAIDAEDNIYIADRHNYRVRKVTCRPPDLVIESASLVGRRSGSTARVRVTIANRGEGEAQGPFSIGVRPGGYAKQGYNSVQQILRRGQSLGAGERIERTLRLPSADSMDFTIDSSRLVEESNEENNSFSLGP